LEWETLEWDLAVLIAQFPRDKVHRERSEPHLPAGCSRNWHEALAALPLARQVLRTTPYASGQVQSYFRLVGTVNELKRI
jgi:hypothetical protein